MATHPRSGARAPLLSHKARNLIHSALLVCGMVGLLAACAAMLWGIEIAFWALFGAVLGLVLMPSVSARTVLSMYGARPLGPENFPQGYEILAELARRGRLPKIPRLSYVPSRVLNAFAVGGRDDAHIALTDGLIRSMSARELAGIIAHEISHIRNRDLWVMNLADIITRLTAMMSAVGLFMLIVLLPLVLLGYASFPVLLPILLIFAPTIGSLLQLALSRAREYDADLDAVALTGDPQGLASALAKLERLQGRLWERILFPGQRIPDPSLLRSHPPTEERIRRILSVQAPDRTPILPALQALTAPAGSTPVAARPRRRWTGAWY